MRIISILITFLFILSLSITAQSYYIVHTKGNIKLVKTDKNIKRGDALNAADKIKFSSKDAIAIAISRTKGRYVISPGTWKTQNSEISYLLKDMLTPHGMLSTRRIGFGSENYPKKLEVIVNPRNKKQLILGGELKILIDKDLYPMNNNHYFSIHYKTSTGEEVKKTLLHKKDTLFIQQKRQIFEIESYLSELYGEVDKRYLEIWLKQKFNAFK